MSSSRVHTNGTEGDRRVGEETYTLPSLASLNKEGLGSSCSRQIERLDSEAVRKSVDECPWPIALWLEEPGVLFSILHFDLCRS